VLAEFGSNQTLRLPQPITEAAKRFCKRRLTICGKGVDGMGWVRGLEGFFFKIMMGIFCFWLIFGFGDFIGKLCVVGGWYMIARG
jgi:hypothetical protein